MRDPVTSNNPEPCLEHSGSGIIAVCGNVAAGKSTLCSLLAATASVQLFLETPDEHLFVRRHYDEPGRWAFHNQVEFLTRKAIQQQSAHTRARPAVLDRCLDECHQVFDRFMVEHGLVSPDEHAILSLLWTALSTVTPKPAVLIYLHAPVEVLMERLAERASPYDQHLHVDWVRRLNQLYGQWIDSLASSSDLCLIAVDTAQTDFRSDVNALVQLQRRIDEGLVW
jgi:deoxyadenosine/deoxycytidine kinase